MKRLLRTSEKGQTLAELAFGGFLLCIAAVIFLALLSPVPDAVERSAANLSASIDAKLPAKELPNLEIMPSSMDDDLSYMTAAVPNVDWEAGHGLRRHPEDVEQVQSCIKSAIGKGTLMSYERWTHPNRFVLACEVEAWVWGIQVLDRDPATGKYRSVTAFIKDTLKSVGDVTSYMDDGACIPAPLP
jgi:hypothetical protein